MTISIIGTGYVGLVTGTCFAEMGNKVWCIDIDKTKIEKLNNGVIPIFEPGLEEMVLRNTKDGRLNFTTEYKTAIPCSEICFIAVGTPPGEDGSADIHYVLEAAKEIARNIQQYTIIVDKSTVPVGTADSVRQTINEILKRRGETIGFDVVSNPEFLKEGVAIEDFMRPDRVVVGTDSKKAAKIMEELYQPFVGTSHPLIMMDIKSAEITKYAANAMLATRISFMNEIAKLCDTVGGDVRAVRKGIGTDKRIGMDFLHASCGYGGSCFPKDVKELIALGKRHGFKMLIAEAVEEVNNAQKKIIVEKITKKHGKNLSGKTFGIWGLAFKPQTDDMRESPAITIITELVKLGAKIKAYDPEAHETAKLYLKDIPKDSIIYTKDMWEAIKEADALILVTEWKQFRQPDFNKIKELLKEPVIFDGKNIYDIELLREKGFEHHCIGRNI